jgi:hypothetical protein
LSRRWLSPFRLVKRRSEVRDNGVPACSVGSGRGRARQQCRRDGRADDVVVDVGDPRPRSSHPRAPAPCGPAPCGPAARAPRGSHDARGDAGLAGSPRASPKRSRRWRHRPFRQCCDIATTPRTTRHVPGPQGARPLSESGLNSRVKEVPLRSLFQIGPGRRDELRQFVLRQPRLPAVPRVVQEAMMMTADQNQIVEFAPAAG